MSLSTTTDINETGVSSADFAAQKIVQANSAILSADVNTIAERAFRRTRYLYEDLLADKIVPYVFTQSNFSGSYEIGPPNLFSGATWTDSSVTVDVPNTVAGDDLRISAWGTWQLNTASAATTIGEMRVHVTEGVGVSDVSAPATGIATILEQPGTPGDPVVQPYMLNVRHRVVNPGTARVTLQLRSEDLTGGAGTATLILQFSARLDVDHHIRS